jgi:hypothetical protein
MRRVAAWMLAFGLVISPAASAATGTDTDKAASDSKKSDSAKKDGKNDTKNSTPAAPSNAEIAAEVEQLRQLLKEQSEQIAELRAALARRDGSAPSAPSANASAAPTAATGSSSTGLSAANSPSPAIPAADPSAPPAARQENKESPLSFRIGGAEFTPGGFVDFENIFRSTNTGNSAATNFWAIPFSNTVGGHLTEFRSTAQNSRFNIKVHDKFGMNDITGYLEMDFVGNDAVNAFVTSNSHTDRLRLYWLDLKRGKWEFLGGQSWGLMTPNRVGVSPLPADVFTTFSEDTNVHVGIPWTRAAQFRAAYHFNDHFVWAAGIENPQQFIGQGAEVVFPFAFNAQLSTQVDAANNNPGAPNVAPDFLTKFAYDNSYSGRHFHVEAGGLLTTVKITNIPNVPNATFVTHSSVGGGVEFGFSFELAKNFSVVANGLWGTGIGRYMIGMGPQFVVRPVQIGPGQFDLQTSMVHSGNGLGGFEWRPTPKTQFGAYYGGVYFQRNAFADPTSPIILGTPISCQPDQPLTTSPCIGFGYLNSANIANKSIQEGTIDWTQTFWSSEQHGKLQFVTQASYLTRAPWFVPLGAPKNAHLTMGFVSLRYVLP